MEISNSPPRLSATVAATIRAEMARQRVTQRQLVERLGWTQPYISRRMAGHVAFDVDELSAIADAIGVPTEDIISTSLAAHRAAVGVA